MAGNSEKTIRKHYLRLLKPEQGNKWFGVIHFAEEMERLQANLRALHPERLEEETYESWRSKEMEEGEPEDDDSRW